LSEEPAAVESRDAVSALDTAAETPPSGDQPEPIAPADAESATPMTATAEQAGPSLDDMMASSTPPAEPAPDGNAAPAEPAAALALSEISIPVEAPPLAPGLPSGALKPDGAAENVETVAARPRGKRGPVIRRPSMPGNQGHLSMIILALIAVVATLFAARLSIVRHAPQMASFYETLGVPVNLRGLKFANVKVTRDMHDGVPVLVVEGTIQSLSAGPVEVPRLRFSLRNDAGSEVYSWTAMPTQSAVLPGEALPFRSRLASPPADALDVQVRFFNRRDAVAGLR
jgi:hypothetical protein